jgi:hypothetical protein
MKQLLWCKDDNVMNKMMKKKISGNNEKCKMLKIDIRSMFIHKKLWN